ncbi:Fc receptor-like protein 5 [Clupea harengus]|uniref:Fc receptor-like protein 5 n=1 Tax=Clupea harengus TaxID=7950 RepID=A0A6P8GYR2_CLUHA|nr:Fc receptor-like protein 5 [Clupea harengus]
MSISLCLWVLVLSLYSHSGHAEETPKAVLVLDPDQTQFYSGETVTLRCSREGQNPSGWWYTWQRGSRQVHPHDTWTKSDAYKIHPLDESHSGTYSCTGIDGSTATTSETKTLNVSEPPDYTCAGVKNGKDVQIETVKLHISALPTATLTVEPQSPVLTGETVTLKCVIESHSGWKYKWYKGRNSNLLSQSDTSTNTITVAQSDEALPETTLSGTQIGISMTGIKTSHVSGKNRKTIIISLPDHAGQYTCEGRRGVQPKKSQRSAPISIIHTAEPTATVSVVSPQGTYYPGDEVTLRCHIAEYTDWYRYSWYRGSDHIHNGQSQTITISLPVHVGQYQYTCEGERGSRPTTSQRSAPLSITLTAMPVPTLTVEPSLSSVFAGETVTLTCVIQPSGGWRYEWYKGWRSLVPKSNTYTISRATVSDQGEYKCSGVRKTNRKSYNSNIVQLTVRALPLATLTVEPHSPVFTGEKVTLKCVIESHSGWVYKWYKDRDNKIVFEGDTFTVKEVTESHNGMYWCKGERKERPTSSQISGKTTVKVQASKPKLTLSPGHQLLTGDSVTLTCELGVSSGLVFYWYRDTQTSDPVAQTDVNSYSIISVKVSDGGQYWCRAGRGDPVYHTQYSDAVEIKVTERPKATVSLKSIWTEFFSGEKVSLRCDIKSGESSDWGYSWFRNGVYKPGKEHEINPSQSGHYTCKGQRKRDKKESGESAAVGIAVSSEKAQADLGSLSQMWPTEGDSVTLSCEVRGSTTGWRFHWYKTNPYSPELVYVLHESREYSLQLVSDSISGAGGSYTLSPAALRRTGVHVCRGERGEPAYHTEFSQHQPLWVTGVSPPVSVIIHSNWNQIFTDESLSLSCGVQGNSTGWRLRWFTYRGGESKCPTDWILETTCSTSSASSSDSGVYWCQSESGEQSNPVNITVHNGNVILESPAHPVTEGDPLTLHCRYRYKPSNISADFYKDGTLLQTSTTGEMTIPAVSESHEGVYMCRNPEKGESPETWVTVRETHSTHVDSGSFIILVVGVVMGISLVLVGAFSVFRLHQTKYLSGLCLTTTATDQQQQQQQQQMSTNQSSDQDQSESEYMPLQNSKIDSFGRCGHICRVTNERIS